MSIVTIKTFSDQFEAHICKGLLEVEGIKCAVINEPLVKKLGVRTSEFDRVKLQCRAEDAEKALKILDQK